MKLSITSTLLEEIRSLAAAAPDEEVCGLLLGAGQRATAILPAQNISAHPANSFEIDPATLIIAHKTARTGGPAIIGCYHSHPNGRVEPSSRDAEQAQDNAIWIIIATQTVSAWHFAHGRFNPCPILPT